MARKSVVRLLLSARYLSTREASLRLILTSNSFNVNGEVAGLTRNMMIVEMRGNVGEIFAARELCSALHVLHKN